MSRNHVFTSVTVNYIPKARVLADSVKKFHPNFSFHLILSDLTEYPKLEQDKKLFDSIIYAKDLPIPNVESWIFKHDVVELCTGVKGIAFQEIIKKYNDADKIIYLDPDTVLFNNLDELLQLLDIHDVILTPHFTEPQSTEESVIDYEISALKHGVFNLGFIAIKKSKQSQLFIEWWTERLINFCYDEITRGIFTDQKWVDFAPAFFENVYILRKSNYNVAIWNLTQRSITGNFDDGILVDNLPLIFYHFSGFNSKVDKFMMNKYSLPQIVSDMREWYRNKQKEMGQQEIGGKKCSYNFFSNGESITKHHRIVYRNDRKLQNKFLNPFDTDENHTSFYDWYKDSLGDNLEKLSFEKELQNLSKDTLIKMLQESQLEIKRYQASKFWKLRQYFLKMKTQFT